MGSGATANNAGAVALGANSTTAAAVATSGATIGGVAYTFAGAAPASVVSVGSVGAERQITNVAAGQISGTSTDAINGSQLFATNQQVTTNTTDIAGNTSAINTLNSGGGIKYFHANSTLTDSSATGTDSVAVGPNASAVNTNSIAIGNGAVANVDNSIALGNGSTTAAANATTGDTINGIVHTYAGGAPTGVLSVGSAGSERQITNVAAGRVSTSSTDAVNGSQLFATNTTVDSLGSTVNNIVSNGTGIKYFHANSTLADSSATGVDSIAIGPQAQASAAQSFAAGAGALASSAGSLALGNLASVSVSGGVALGQGSVSDRAIAPASGPLVVNGGTITYDTTDATLLGAVSLGTAGQYRQLINLADGSSAQDAVTLRQLGGAIGSLSSTGSLYFHANSTNPQDSLAIGLNAIAVGPATVVNADNGIGMGNNAVVSQAATGGIALGGNSQVLMASGVAIGTQAQAQGEQSVALGAGAVASHAASVALGSGSVTTVGAQAGYAATGLTTLQTSVGEVGVGTALGSRQITGVAAGSAPNDAVNVSQLGGAITQANQYTDTAVTNLGGNVVEVLKDVNNLKNGTEGMSQVNNTSGLPKPVVTGTDAVASGAGSQATGNNSTAVGSSAHASGDKSVALGSGATATGTNSVALGNNSTATRDDTVSVGAPGKERQITNVAPATEGTDAVNFDQLNRTTASATNNANNYTDQRFSQLKSDLNKQDRVLSAGIAGAMAMASLPQPYVAGGSMTAMGAATYRGQGAVSFGVSRVSDNGHWVGKLQASTTTQGNFGVGVGVGYQW
nr:YadA family autotransporter adhesin [Pseudomonas fragi]